MRGIVIAGTSSGIGKTTITLAVMNALRGEVQPYKVGPDYIDPSHHKEITEKPSRNLDIFMMDEKGVRENYSRGEGDFGVIEGVMGLYDSYEESTAKVAEILDLPVILVVDATNGMESVAATALGFKEYGEVDVAGVIVNKVSSKKQLEGIKDGLKRAEIDYLGMVQYENEFEIPSRHLGLYMGKENPLDEEKLNKVSKNLKIEEITNKTREKSFNLNYSEENDHIDEDIPKIGVACDPAFNFYYTRNIEILSKISDPVFFSPIEDELPLADGYYFGGGYPELYIKNLSENSSIKDDLVDAASRGKPIFGECGGFMYLSDKIKYKGENYKMAGILPVEIEMTDSLQSVGYSRLKAKKDSPISDKGEYIKGHEFHYSKSHLKKDAKTVFDMKRGKGVNGKEDGVIEYNALGCYTHLHGCTQGYLNKFVYEAREKR
ncbi:MAG: Cobyrinic acid ac-diamide synthase CobB [Candidatus Methanohalarchaeum thermophilum]|uniref:Cobyrinate a,c-diamide synthase n=1 Tax=Methanohalarchaeum thermophilum TaxID=1903181 RepID=A0A1Q6DUM7_METT1|nr:MAG: Cobyrinic acid ac-diamide synthase CobB [Candidatus Methanohalarchaeum thermophilum]